MEDQIKIKKADNGRRIDVIAHEKFPQISRSRWMKCGIFIFEEGVQASKTKAREGQIWKISCPKETMISADVSAWDFPLRILAKSKTWVAIEKPIGVSVHPSPSDPGQETIVNALVHQFGKELSENFDEIEGRQIPRPGLVHRLDKTTSGVLLIAKTNETHRYLQEHWKECEKIYRAIVTGKTPRKGRIEGPIFRDPQNRKRMSVSKDPRAKSATTLFETLSSASGLSHLEVQILTGRTHQIRVHLSSIGFPIFGDALYDGIPSTQIFLHAHSLTFPNPDDEGNMKTVKSDVPINFEKAKLEN